MDPAQMKRLRMLARMAGQSGLRELHDKVLDELEVLDLRLVRLEGFYESLAQHVAAIDRTERPFEGTPEGGDGVDTYGSTG